MSTSDVGVTEKAEGSHDRQVVLDHLVKENMVSLTTMYAIVGLNYKTEIENKKKEITDLKSLAYEVQKPFEK